MAGALLCGLIIAVDPLELRPPSWVTWQSRSYATDLDNDGSAEQITLERGALLVEGSTGIAPYRTPASWRVQDAVICDVTRDGIPEICMLVWRRGNYGSSRPFWDTGVDLRMTEHLYVLGARDAEVVPVWMGHELGCEVSGLLAHDDGSISLVARDGTKSHRSWEGFGFVVI